MQLRGDALKCSAQSEPGLDADHHEVERVGECVSEYALPALDFAIEHEIRKDQPNESCGSRQKHQMRAVHARECRRGEHEGREETYGEQGLQSIEDCHCVRRLEAGLD